MDQNHPKHSPFVISGLIRISVYKLYYNAFHRMIYKYGDVGLIIRWTDEEGGVE